MLGRISILQRAIRVARNGKWPFSMKVVSADAVEMNIEVHNVDDLARWIGMAMDSIEREIGLNGD